MNVREFFAKRWEMEQPTFLRVLRALPADKLSYRPNERSTSAGDLAWQIAEEQKCLCDLVDKGVIQWDRSERPATLDEIVSAYEKNTDALRKKLGKLDDQKFDSGGKFRMGENLVGESSVRDFLWGFLFDMVHHRGQLAAYIRPMGGKVPSIYGPSGDEAPARP
jgi:uncharacterized damage-inducible protein DinB